MSKKDLTEIVVIVDGSGSMGPIRNDAIGGFNTFIEEQKKVSGEAICTVVLFNTKHDKLCDGIRLDDVKLLDATSYVPSGQTALLDSIGIAIDAVGERLNGMPEDERPEKVIVAILTDGEENSSREYNHRQILGKIAEQRDKWKWEFVFLAANQDAIKAGTSLGISADKSIAFVATSEGTRDAFKDMSHVVRSYRTGK